jgi:hypothetical protein
MAHDDRVDGPGVVIEQAEKQEPLVNIELSRRMAAVKVSNFYGSIIKDAEKEIQRLHGLVLQHTAPPQRQPLTDEQIDDIWNRYCDEMGEASINDAYDIMTCPDCERYKISASMWRNKAYELSGAPLPWNAEELIEKAVLAEREACAKLCDHMAARCNDIRAAALESAAENIRARGEKK